MDTTQTEEETRERREKREKGPKKHKKQKTEAGVDKARAGLAVSVKSFAFARPAPYGEQPPGGTRRDLSWRPREARAAWAASCRAQATLIVRALRLRRGSTVVHFSSSVRMANVQFGRRGGKRHKNASFQGNRKEKGGRDQFVFFCAIGCRPMSKSGPVRERERESESTFSTVMPSGEQVNRVCAIWPLLGVCIPACLHVLLLLVSAFLVPFFFSRLSQFPLSRIRATGGEDKRQPETRRKKRGCHDPRRTVRRAGPRHPPHCVRCRSLALYDTE